MQTRIDAVHEEIRDNPQPRTRPISGEPGGLALAMMAGAAAAPANKGQGARKGTMATGGLGLSRSADSTGAVFGGSPPRRIFCPERRLRLLERICVSVA